MSWHFWSKLNGDRNPSSPWKNGAGMKIREADPQTSSSVNIPSLYLFVPQNQLAQEAQGTNSSPVCLISLWECMHAKSLQSCLTLRDPMGYSLPDSSVHCILQERAPEWVSVPSSRTTSWCRDWTCVSSAACIGRQALSHQHHLGSPESMCISLHNKHFFYFLNFFACLQILSWWRKNLKFTSNKTTCMGISNKKKIKNFGNEKARRQVVTNTVEKT